MARLYDESKTIGGVEILWDTQRGKMASVGRDLVGLWLDPSLLNTLIPLREEIGTELFQLLVAHSSSIGAKADYDKMVSVLADNFEEGFLAWGKAVGGVGWGRFELHSIDRSTGTAKVVVRSPWELVMQQRLEDPWGCPFLRGKLIGIFRYALGVNCWADERAWVEDGEPVVEFSLYQSSLTIESETERLRRQLANDHALELQAEVDLRTEQLRSSQERLRATLSSLDSWVITLDVEGRIQAEHRPDGSSFPPAEIGMRIVDVLPPEAGASMDAAMRRVAVDQASHVLELVLPRESGQLHYRVVVSPLRDAERWPSGVTVVVHDVTRQRESERVRANLEAQLQQSQKMEAIGQLTGGVAHDFNNLLTIIAGNLELAAVGKMSDDARERLRDAMGAVGSAATLVRQLLAFARKQPLRPHRLDARTLVAEMESLLRRTLGERIDLEFIGSAGQWTCEVDRDQLKSAILNLVINARDAMPDGGKITVETGNMRISPEYADEHDDIDPGQYVLVAVSDTGVGMPDDIKRKAFEPFFTTKRRGHGSGLGLSMVYGFVRQSRGHVKIYSEPGAGTTVKLYLPRALSGTEARESAEPVKTVAPPREGAAVLVVEDEALVRRVSVRFLRALGYRTFDCSDATDALDILRSDARIDVLLTDVVLPGPLNGPRLAAEAQALRPDLAVLYTSGYTENAIVHHGQLDPGVRLLEKPFTQETLARRLCAALSDRRPPT